MTAQLNSQEYPSASRARFAICTITLAYILSFIDRQVLSLLVEPMKRDLGITDVQVSLLQGLAFASIYCVAGLPLGRAADQYSRRNIIMGGVLFWSFMTSACGIASGYGVLLLCRAGVGVGEAALTPSAYSMLSDYFQPRRLAAAMSFYSLGSPVGGGLAYLLGGIILSFAGETRTISIGFLHDLRPWQSTFLLIGALGIVVVALLAFVTEPARQIAPQEANREPRFGETMALLGARWRTLGVFIIGLALLGMLNYATASWYPSMFSRSFAEPANRVGLIYGPIYVVASVVGTVIGGWGALKTTQLGYQNPYIRWVFGASIGVVVCSVVTPLLPDLHSTYAACALLILVQNSWFGTAVAALHLSVPNRMRAQITAILLFSTNVFGLGAGPSAVASLTQYAFHNENALRYSLSLFSLLAGGAACIAFKYSLRHFGKLPQTV